MKKDYLLKYLKKVLTGFTYGVGFALALTIVSTILGKITEWRNSEIRYSELQRSGSVEKSIWFSKFQIEDRGMTMADNGPQIMATITNNSEKNAIWVFLRTDLFNKSGDFVYQCDGQVRQMAPYTKKNVKIQCDLKYSEDTRRLRDSIFSQKTYVYQAME